MEFWHSAFVDKSFYTLQSLRKEYDFVLIGGWAVFLYTKTIKSKDIDIIVEPEILSKLKTKFEVIKNERLKKYEIKMDGFDIDIYVPFWSELGLPPDFILENTISLEGFSVPKKEILLILKIFTYKQRKGSLKGKKDKLDIVSLLYHDHINLEKFKEIIRKFNLECLKDELVDLLDSTFELPELSLNQKQFADFKRKIKNNLN